MWTPLQGRYAAHHRYWAQVFAQIGMQQISAPAFSPTRIGGKVDRIALFLNLQPPWTFLSEVQKQMLEGSSKIKMEKP